MTFLIFVFLSLVRPIVISPSIDYNIFRIIIHRVTLNMKIGRRSKVYEKMYTIKLILIRLNQTVKHSGRHVIPFTCSLFVKKSMIGISNM